MESCEELTSDLWYERRETASLVSAGNAPIVQLRRGAGRAHVDLVLLRGARTIEVSVQPATPVDLVRERAQWLGHDPNGWTGALASAVAGDARQWRLWAGGGSVPDLLCLFGAMTHPVLGAAYDPGAQTVRRSEVSVSRLRSALAEAVHPEPSTPRLDSVGRCDPWFT